MPSSLAAQPIQLAQAKLVVPHEQGSDHLFRSFQPSHKTIGSATAAYISAAQMKNAVGISCIAEVYPARYVL